MNDEEVGSTDRRYATPALEKGLDVLELLAREPEGLTKSEVARKLNRTVSEIFRMLVCLEQRGYIVQLREERYTLTLKLYELAHEHPPTERLVTDAIPVLQRVAHDTLQSCHLGVLDSDRVAILAQANAPSSIGFYVKLGATVDLMDAASGYVILAHQPPDQRDRILAAWRRTTGLRLPRDLHQHLDRIRRAGFERRSSYLAKGVTNISFPVFDRHHAALGAITMPYIESNLSAMPLKSVIEVLRNAAAEITAAVGGVLPRRRPAKI